MLHRTETKSLQILENLCKKNETERIDNIIDFTPYKGKIPKLLSLNPITKAAIELADILKILPQKQQSKQLTNPQ